MRFNSSTLPSDSRAPAAGVSQELFGIESALGAHGSPVSTASVSTSSSLVAMLRSAWSRKPRSSSSRARRKESFMAYRVDRNLDPELIIVARGGKVAKDHGESIEGKRAEIIDASPDALAYASAGAGQPTLGQVGADDARRDGGRGSLVVEDATA